MTHVSFINDPIESAASASLVKSKTKMELRNGEVHLWQVDLDPTRAIVQDHLSVDELERGARFHFARHRNSFYARRVALRRILSLYVGKRPAELVFEYDPWGKPQLSSRESQQHIEFSVSRAKNIALVAVTANRRVGVDLEFEDNSFDYLSVAEQCFSAREMNALRRLDGPDLRAGFYRIWAGNEALGKAIGCGLMQPEDRQHFDQSSFLFETEPRCAIHTGSPAAHWMLERLKLELPGFHAAICVEGCERVDIVWQPLSLLASPECRWFGRE